MFSCVSFRARINLFTSPSPFFVFPRFWNQESGDRVNTNASVLQRALGAAESWRISRIHEKCKGFITAIKIQEKLLWFIAVLLSCRYQDFSVRALGMCPRLQCQWMKSKDSRIRIFQHILILGQTVDNRIQRRRFMIGENEIDNWLHKFQSGISRLYSL